MTLKRFLLYITNNEEMPRHEPQFDIAFFVINTVALVVGCVLLSVSGEIAWIPFLIIEYTWALDNMRHNRE